MAFELDKDSFIITTKTSLYFGLVINNKPQPKFLEHFIRLNKSGSAEYFVFGGQLYNSLYCKFRNFHKDFSFVKLRICEVS